MGVEALDVLADQGYFSGEEILACERLGVTPNVPKPFSSGAKADGRFGKQDFSYLPDHDAYRCPAGQILKHHMTTVEKGHLLTRPLDSFYGPIWCENPNPRLERAGLISSVQASGSGQRLVILHVRNVGDER